MYLKILYYLCIMTVKELKDFIKDLPDETIVKNNLATASSEKVDLVYKKSTAYSDVLIIN